MQSVQREAKCKIDRFKQKPSFCVDISLYRSRRHCGLDVSPPTSFDSRPQHRTVDPTPMWDKTWSDMAMLVGFSFFAGIRIISCEVRHPYMHASAFAHPHPRRETLRRRMRPRGRASHHGHICHVSICFIRSSKNTCRPCTGQSFAP
jgi:hypothetical protein